MKIIFHPNFLQAYDSTPAGKPGRLEPTIETLQNNKNYVFIKPEPADYIDIKRAHSENHINSLKESSLRYKKIFQMAKLAAGGAIKCASLIMQNEPSFGLIRPPGHHASFDSAWGFCYFNNLAISLLYLRDNSAIKSAFILDFDLHLGDGNINILQKYGDYEIYNPDASSEAEYLNKVEKGIQNAKPCDIIVASAGFDQGQYDWGKLLSPSGYKKIGQLLKKKAKERCEGRRYALLEGGYNPSNMARNIEAFLLGFSD